MSEVEILSIKPDDLQLMSLQLAKMIYDSGYRPTRLIALWRGGAPIGMYIHEYFKFKGHNIDHIAIRTSAYEGKEQKKEIRVHGLGYIIDNANYDDKVLIVDDIFDSGRTAEKVIENMRDKMRKNMPETVKFATIFYKPTKRVVDFEPDYYVKEINMWIDYPHELEGLTLEKIRELKGEKVYELLI